MAKYLYLVTVETEKREHADVVIGERMGYDEEISAFDLGGDEEMIFPGSSPIVPEGAVPIIYSLDFTFLERNDA